MSGQITLFGASQILASNFSKTVTPPLNYYLALIPSTSPTAFISGDELIELSGNGYARVQVPNDGTAWKLTNGQNAVTNVAGITFAAATGDWGQIRYWALCDALTGGNSYFYGAFDSPVVVNNTDILTVAAGNLVISVDAFYVAG